MIRINLLPRQRRRTLAIPEFGVVGVIVVVIGVLIAAYVYGKVQNGLVRAQVELLNRQIADVRPKAAEVLTLEARIERLRAKEELLKSLEARQLAWPELLADLAPRTPRDSWLQSASFTPSPLKLILGGTAFSYDSVARYMRNLQSSPYYGEVDLNAAAESQSVGHTLVIFSLVVTVRPTPAPLSAQGNP